MNGGVEVADGERGGGQTATARWMRAASSRASQDAIQVSETTTTDQTGRDAHAFRHRVPERTPRVRRRSAALDRVEVDAPAV